MRSGCARQCDHVVLHNAITLSSPMRSRCALLTKQVSMYTIQLSFWTFIRNLRLLVDSFSPTAKERTCWWRQRDRIIIEEEGNVITLWKRQRHRLRRECDRVVEEAIVIALCGGTVWRRATWSHWRGGQRNRIGIVEDHHGGGNVIALWRTMWWHCGGQRNRNVEEDNVMDCGGPLWRRKRWRIVEDIVIALWGRTTQSHCGGHCKDEKVLRSRYILVILFLSWTRWEQMCQNESKRRARKETREENKAKTSKSCEWEGWEGCVGVWWVGQPCRQCWNQLRVWWVVLETHMCCGVIVKNFVVRRVTMCDLLRSYSTKYSKLGSALVTSNRYWRSLLKKTRLAVLNVLGLPNQNVLLLISDSSNAKQENNETNLNLLFTAA
jgi:hypothetical protein